MPWIEIAPGIFAEEATPDPKRIVTSAELLQELEMLNQEKTMITQEISMSSSRAATLDSNIMKLKELLK